jgi:hypothetical protein
LYFFRAFPESVILLPHNRPGDGINLKCIGTIITAARYLHLKFAFPAIHL